jgi:hypothetical protein
MSEQPLGREEVARIAIALKGLERYKETELYRLIKPACGFLLACEKAANDPKRGDEEDERWFVRDKAAKLVTGNPRPSRAMNQFERYLEFLNHTSPGEFFNKNEGYLILFHLHHATPKADGFPEWFCKALQEKFGAWQKLEFSERQRRKAKNSRKKFLPGVMVKKSKLMAAKREPAARKT